VVSADRPGPRVTDEFLTVAEVAALLRLNPQTIRNWIENRTLPAVRIGRRVRVLRRDLDALVEHGRTVGPGPEASRGADEAERFWDGEPFPSALTDSSSE
jgi:excisionase family DNA binding protein